MNLRNLLQWELIQKVHYPGERKDFFTAEKDVWNVVAALIKERHQREVNPIRESLTEELAIFDDHEEQTEEEILFRDRNEEFIELFDMFERFIHDLLPYINRKKHSLLKHR